MKCRTNTKLNAKKKSSKGKNYNFSKFKMAASAQIDSVSPCSTSPEVPLASQNRLSKVFSPLPNKSALKLRNSELNMEKMSPSRQMETQKQTQFSSNNTLQGNSIMDLQILSNVFSDSSMCSKCKNPDSKLSLKENIPLRKGLCQSFTLVCSKCDAVSNFMSSKKNSEAYEVNMKSVHASCQGMGLSRLLKMTAQLDLPPPVSCKPYSKIVRDLRDDAKILSEKAMIEAADRVFANVKENSPENIVNIDGESVAKTAVDGTCQRRGYSSKYGVVFVLSVDTEEVLDAIAKSLY